VTTRRLPRLAGIAVAAALLGVACGGTSDSADIASAPAPTAAPAPGDEAPDIGTPEILAFTSSLVGGGQFDGAELTDKPTAFWFWSPT
jgi:hypothetical protein